MAFVAPGDGWRWRPQRVTGPTPLAQEEMFCGPEGGEERARVYRDGAG